MKQLVFENNAPFIGCVLKINNIFSDRSEDLDIVMPMYNLIECSKNYSKTTGSLWNYYRDEPNSGAEENINFWIKDSNCSDYKASITGKLQNDIVEKENVETVVPLKYLTNLWRTLDILLINCEASLTLTFSKNYIITSEATRDADPDADPAEDAVNDLTNAKFKTAYTKLYVTVVTLSTEDDNKLLEQLKAECIRTIKWKKYRSEKSNQLKSNRVNYLIDPKFKKVNRLFVLSFENEDDRRYVLKYYTPNLKVKGFK